MRREEQRLAGRYVITTSLSADQAAPPPWSLTTRAWPTSSVGCGSSGTSLPCHLSPKRKRVGGQVALWVLAGVIPTWLGTRSGALTPSNRCPHEPIWATVRYPLRPSLQGRRPPTSRDRMPNLTPGLSKPPCHEPAQAPDLRPLERGGRAVRRG
jgi:hypothetical protein